MRPSPDVLFRALDDGAVLVHLENNAIFELNATAAHAWALVERGAAPEAIAHSLVETFDIDHAQASLEVDALLTRLTRDGLICP